MMFLYIFIIAAVCGTHFTTAAPKPLSRSPDKNDERAILRDLLFKLDKKTLNSWLERRDSDVSVFDTNEPENEGDEELDIQTDAPEMIATATSLPASQKILPDPVCKDRLTDPDQIKDIEDVKTRHDVIEYLIYRLCLPTVDADDVLAVSAIVDRLEWPTRKPVVGLPNPFVPEEGVIEAVPEETPRPVLDQEMPGARVMAIDSDIDDAGVTPVADENDAQTEETFGLEWLFGKVGERIAKLPLIGSQEDKEEDEEGNEKRDEPVMMTDAPYLMTTSLPAPGESILHSLCKDRLDNPDQIKSIGDIKNRHDVIEYLLYRLCLPTITEEDVRAIATVVEQLFKPIDTQPDPIVEPEVDETESEPTTKPLDDNEPNLIVEPEFDEIESEPTTKPLDDNDEGDSKVDVQLTEVITTPTLSLVDQLKLDLDTCLNKLRIHNKKKMNKANRNKQALSATPIPSNPIDTEDDDVIEEEAVPTVQPLDEEQDIDLDDLEMIVRNLLDELLMY